MSYEDREHAAISNAGLYASAASAVGLFAYLATYGGAVDWMGADTLTAKAVTAFSALAPAIGISLAGAVAGFVGYMVFFVRREIQRERTAASGGEAQMAGESTVNMGRGFLRAWVVVSALWALLVGGALLSGYNRPDAGLFLWIVAGPPAVLYAIGRAIGWIFAGFRA